jgi:GST-like protein
MGQEISDFPHLTRWLDAVLARAAVQRGLDAGMQDHTPTDLATDREAQAVLFNQRAR